ISDGQGLTADMKSVEGVSVTNPATEYLWISAAQPKLSHRYATQWNLLSLPVRQDDAAVGALFPSAVSSAFFYNPSASYMKEDSLRPGPGYWLKFSRGLDTFPRIGTPRL